MKKRDVILCSACLLGEKCRYDGQSKADEKVLILSKKVDFVPVCPEVLGGLSTPREKSERKGDKVFSQSGKDVTREFQKGAEETLKIARENKIRKAILKQRSPSCGSGQTYDGTFSGKIIKGDGMTAELLKRNGIEVTTEEDL